MDDRLTQDQHIHYTGIRKIWKNDKKNNKKYILIYILNI